MEFLRDILAELVVTLISAFVLAWATPFLKAKRPIWVNWVWRTSRIVFFLILFALLLFYHSTDFDRTEIVALSLFITFALIFEAFLNWQAIYRHSRAFLRILFNVSIVYLILNITASKFDQTEILTIIQFFVLNLIFELVRAKGKTTEVDTIRYEINCKISRQRLKSLFASNNVSIPNVNRVISRSFLHVGAYLNAELVGFVSLIWSGDGPAEVDYLSINPLVTGVELESIRLLENEAQDVGIEEMQISNKVIRSNAKLAELLAQYDYQTEKCLVKHFGENRGADAT